MTELTQLYEEKEQLKDLLREQIDVLRTISLRLHILVEEGRLSKQLMTDMKDDILNWKKQDDHYHTINEKQLRELKMEKSRSKGDEG